MVLSLVVTDADPSGPAYLAQVAAQPNQVALGVLLLLLAGLALVLVPVGLQTAAPSTVAGTGRLGLPHRRIRHVAGIAS